jgi:hypothetical protein
MGESMRPHKGSALRHELALALLRPRPWTPDNEATITVDLNEAQWDAAKERDSDSRFAMPDALHGMYYLG